MTPRRCSGAPRWGRAPRGGSLLVALTVACALALTSLPSAAAGYGSSGPVSWTNGLVLCQFAPSTPTVAASALALGGTGLTTSLDGMSEQAPNGSVVASAAMNGATWTVANASTDDAYILIYTLHAQLTGPGGTGPAVGSANASVAFILPVYAGSPDGPTDTVQVSVTVAQWTWQASGDHLALSFAVAPSFPSTERLNLSESEGWLLDGVAVASGAPQQRLGMNTTASATSPSGTSGPVPAVGNVTLASPSSAQVAVSFGTSAGAFRVLTFVAQIGIVLPATVAGIPLSEIAAAGAAGVLASLAVAAVARRVRKRPSRLVFVTEEEGP